MASILVQSKLISSITSSIASLFVNKPSPNTLRISLVGKTGSGKSSTGNTILGREVFVAETSSTSITKNCSKAEAEVDGRSVAVVDTPGLFDTSVRNEETIIETYNSVSLLAPGPHAFLLLVKIGRFTAEEKGAVEYIKAAFGERAQTYIMVLFTKGDDLEYHGKTIEDYIKNADPALKELISSCGNRFHVFNNRKKDRAQVKELLQKIDHMVTQNGGSYYTNDMLREAEEAIEKEKERILKEKEEEIRREEKKIRRKYQQEMEKMLQKENQKQEEEKRQMEEKIRETEEKLKKEQELRAKEEKEREKERKDWERETKEKLKKKEEQQGGKREWIEKKTKFMDEKMYTEIAQLNRTYREDARRQAEMCPPVWENIWPYMIAALAILLLSFLLFRRTR